MYIFSFFPSRTLGKQHEPELQGGVKRPKGKIIINHSSSFRSEIHHFFLLYWIGRLGDSLVDFWWCNFCFIFGINQDCVSGSHRKLRKTHTQSLESVVSLEISHPVKNTFIIRTVMAERILVELILTRSVVFYRINHEFSYWRT